MVNVIVFIIIIIIIIIIISFFCYYYHIYYYHYYYSYCLFQWVDGIISLVSMPYVRKAFLSHMQLANTRISLCIWLGPNLIFNRGRVKRKDVFAHAQNAQINFDAWNNFGTMEICFGYG